MPQQAKQEEGILYTAFNVRQYTCLPVADAPLATTGVFNIEVAFASFFTCITKYNL